MVKLFRRFEGRGDSYVPCSEAAQEEYLCLQSDLKKNCERVAGGAKLILWVETKGEVKVKKSDF